MPPLSYVQNQDPFSPMAVQYLSRGEADIDAHE